MPERSNILFEDAAGNEVLGRRFINPDGSVGGIVPMDMPIPRDVFIHSTAVVHPGAELAPGQRVRAYEILVAASGVEVET